MFIRLIETYDVPPFICEIGGGTGRFAYAVLEQWKRQSPNTFEKGKYTIVETSPYHREKQAETLASLIDHVHIVSSFAELSSAFPASYLAMNYLMLFLFMSLKTERSNI